MTTFSNIRTGLALAAVASAVLGCTAISAETDEAAAETQGPIACVITADTSNGALVLQPVVQATEDISGTYQMRIQGPSTRMNQGGPFSVDAGETLQLGATRLAGAATNVEADLTLTVDGTEYRCPSDL